MKYNGSKLARAGKIGLLFISIALPWMAGCAATSTASSSEKALVNEESSMASSIPKNIESIQATDSPEESIVSIKSNAKLVYTSVKQSFPLGVVLIFPQTAITNQTVDSAQGSDLISNVETSVDSQSGTAKVSIFLKSDSSYEVLQNNSDMKIVFKKGSLDRMQEPDENKAAGGVDRIPESNDSGSDPSIVNKPTWVNRIDFSSEDQGKSTVTIGTTHAAKYDLQKVSENIVKLKLFNTSIPDYHQRQLITTRFESAIDRIIPAQTPDMGNNSVISFELRESVPYFVEQNKDLILVHFEASKIPPRPLESADLPSWKKILDQPIAETEDIEQAMVSPGEMSSDDDLTIRTTDQYFDDKVYTGEKISLDFYETDIKNVFRILREISGKNFIIDDDVKGKVTMTPDKPVPWDQILDLVLKMNQLGLVYEGNIVRIAKLSTIKRESSSLMESVTAEREAKEKIKDMAPLMTEYVSVNYSKAKEEILPHIEGVITRDRGSVSVDDRNNQIIITDTAEKIARVKEIIRNIDKVTPQVIIEAKVVEVNKNVQKDIGVDWASEGGIQNDDPNAGVGPQRGMHALGGTYGWGTAMNFPVENGGQIGFNFTRIAGTPYVLNAKLSALETNGDAKIISAPKIVTLDNKKALIRQGLEVGYYDTDKNNTEGRTVEFKKVDLLLEVTPHVTPDSRVSMSIFITKNDVQDYYEGIPSIASNEAQTELLVNDGDTIVIGGIMKTTNSSGETGFPGLSKIPGLGMLFRHDSKTNMNNELLIFITPRIVQLEQKAAI
jgi:type IV pilus assembly protein PilQ